MRGAVQTGRALREAESTGAKTCYYCYRAWYRFSTATGIHTFSFVATSTVNVLRFFRKPNAREQVVRIKMNNIRPAEARAEISSKEECPRQQ